MSVWTVALLVVSAPEPMTIAVPSASLDAQAREEIPRFFDDVLYEAVERAGPFTVVGQTDIDAVLDYEKQRATFDCDDSWCLADIAGAFGAHKQLQFRVARLHGRTGRGWVVVGKLMDVRELRIELLHSSFVAGGVTRLLAALPQLIGDILRGDRPAPVVRPSPFQDKVMARAADDPRRGVQCDPSDPVDCEKQCLLRHAGSCETLAASYFSGKGLPAVWGRAAIFYEQACELGAAGACNNLGVLHSFGFGVAEDGQRARDLFELACDGGDSSGCRHLGMMLAKEAPATLASW